MKNLLGHLNPEQRQAVTTTEGPLLVLAGAGSGKTRVVTTRVAHLIQRGVPASAILAVTFTNKAAEEMRERIEKLAGPAARGVTACTFHSLGLEILRAESPTKGRRARYAILDQGDQIGVVREILRRIEAGRAFDAWALLERISRAKNAFLGPAELPEPRDEYDEMAQVVYPAYEEALGALRARDFDDLICEPVRLFERDPEVRERWQSRFRYVHVDEYQDTNHAQLRFGLLLAGKHRNLCVVGDDDQSIYAWRGADLRNILEFERTFPDAKVVKLEENYRSTQVILEAANAVIAKNAERHPKRLRTSGERGDLVRVVTAATPEEEAGFVAREIQKLCAEGRKPSDVAVLYRATNLARHFEEALRVAEVPFRMSGGSQFFARKEVKDALAYLRALVLPNDELALRRIINYPARGVGAATLEAATRVGDEKRIGLAEALLSLPGESGGPRAARDFLAVLSEARKSARTAPLAEVGRQLLDRVGIREDLADAASKGEVAERRWGAVLDLLRSVERYEQRAGKGDLGHYLNLLTLRSAGEDEADAEAGVTLSTLHGVKGLEFPVVFLVAFEEDLMPHARTLTAQGGDVASGDVSEERRLCYVGITRARERLYITRAAMRPQRGGARQRTPSRFLADIPAELQSVHSLEEMEEDRRTRGLAEVRAAMKQLFD
jgi:DNA helicase-2/ATP-dependent DNA helicase PcrA